MIPTIDAPIQCQSDHKWRSLTLGFSTFPGCNIGTYGCAVTCLSMLINALDKRAAYTPDTVNELLKEVKAFAGPWGNYVCWNLVPNLLYAGRFDCPTVPLPQHVADQIDRNLEDRTPVIVYVDGSLATGLQQHFVLIVGKGDTGYIINDPYYGDRARLCPRYGKADAIAICGVVFYTRG